MSGYFTEGQIGNSLAEAQGTDLLPATTGEVLSAQFGQTFAENPATRLARLVARNLEPNPITLSVEEANERYGVPGRLRFTEPVTVTQARDLHDFHMASARREDVIQRRQGGVGTGLVARFGVGVAASILDPLNVAAAFIPFFGQARIAAALGGTATRGAAGRFGVRAIEGAGQGFLGAAAIEPLNMWLSAQDQDDYTMGDALVNLAFGTALGGVLHGGLGVIRDRNSLPAWTPEMHEAATRQAAAALVEGRPIQAAAAMEFTAARSARDELRTWYEATARVAREADEAMARMDSASGAVAPLRARLLELREEADKVRGEIADARGRLADAGIEPETRARLAEVDAELAGTIPRQRRAALERERDMLLEGRNWAAEAPGLQPLEAGRTQAEIAGLEAVQERVDAALLATEAKLREAMALRRQAGDTFSARSAALSAREGITRDLAARTIRRAAGRMGVALEADEAAEMASRLIRAEPNQVRAVLDDILSDLSKRTPYGPYLPDDVFTPPGATVFARAEQALAARERRAEQVLADSARGTPDARDLAADRLAAERAEVAPKVEGTVADELAEAEKSVKELSDALNAADKAYAERVKAEGREPPEPDPELAEADELAKEGENMGRAFDAAATCAIGRV